MLKSRKRLQTRHLSSHGGVISSRSGIKAGMSTHLAVRLIGVMASATMICALNGVAASASPTNGLAKHRVHTIRFSPAERAALHRLESTPQGRAKLVQAFRESLRPIGKVTFTPPTHKSQIRFATCAPGISCGLSSSGGWHFWIITSYAAAATADLVVLNTECMAALAPVLQWWGIGICWSVVGTIWAMVNNWPRMTNHGIWMAIYRWGIQDGRW